MRVALLLSLVISLAGCGPSMKDVEFTTYPISRGPMDIYFELGKFDQKTKNKLVEACSYHWMIFNGFVYPTSSKFTMNPPRVRVMIVKSGYISMAGGEPYVGVPGAWKPGRIWVSAYDYKRQPTVPDLIHQLAHIYIDDDAYHQDPSWPGYFTTGEGSVQDLWKRWQVP